LPNKKIGPVGEQVTVGVGQGVDAEEFVIADPAESMQDNVGKVVRIKVKAFGSLRECFGRALCLPIPG